MKKIHWTILKAILIFLFVHMLVVWSYVSMTADCRQMKDNREEKLAILASVDSELDVMNITNEALLSKEEMFHNPSFYLNSEYNNLMTTDALKQGAITEKALRDRLFLINLMTQYGNSYSLQATELTMQGLNPKTMNLTQSYNSKRLDYARTLRVQLPMARSELSAYMESLNMSELRVCGIVD